MSTREVFTEIVVSDLVRTESDICTTEIVFCLAFVIVPVKSRSVL